MGNMKFEMPNDYGIYLHDTPVKENFAKAEPLDQQWLRAAPGLSPLRQLGVRLVPQPATNREQGSTCPSRCRCS